MSNALENFRLRVFRILARQLNFRRAAEELRLTQPAVTSQIKALEEEAGVALFDRAGGRVTLTPQGALLLEYADRLHQLAEEATQALAALSNNTAGSLAIGASQTIGQYLLPNLIAGFLRKFPGVQLTTLGGNTEEVLEALANHRVDVALIEGPAMRRDIRTEAFLEDHMVLVVPAGDPWADAEIEVTDLLKAPLLTRELGSGSRRVVESALEQAGVKIKELQFTLTLDSTEGLLSAVEAGLGAAFVSRWAVRNQLTLGTLRIAHVRGLKLARMMSIAHPAGPNPAGNAGAFAKFVLQNANEMLPRSTGLKSTKKARLRLASHV
jgi:DNA-binding transcriptional LysR family regulator